MKQFVVIFDIDGTLADTSRRRKHLEGKKKDWDAFYGDMANDDPIETTVELLHMFRENGSFPIFVTGRPSNYRDLTEAWLAKYCNVVVGKHNLFMRREGNFKPDFEVKYDIYHKYIKDKFDVKLVVDDRNSVVRMWRSLDLICWQVAHGDF